MHVLDWAVLIAFFALMVAIGWWAKSHVNDAQDFFTAGGKMPWWLSGVSHHMSGYSAAVYVGYAAIAYTAGFTIYVWWALTITFAMVFGSYFFAPRWSRLRQKFHIISPMEYLARRYNVPTQQLLAWCGVILKFFDVGAKWTATAVLLNVFAGVPIYWGVLMTGLVTMFYATVGGLWADAMTDFSQFIIQLLAGVVMFVVVLAKMGGVSSLWTVWSQLPPGHSQPFNGDYTAVFALSFLLINTLSYNGGTWNLAQRFIASPSGKSARRAALLSAALYLVWPLVLFFPMWAAPILMPDLANPSQSYALLAQNYLPHGLIGLVLAGMFAHTMAMTSSDSNAIAAVVTRDILPTLWKGVDRSNQKTELFIGRLSTFIFVAGSMVVALMADRFGGVLGLIILWFGALIGPIAIPMLLGMLPWFRRSGPSAAIISLAAGLTAFALIKYVFAADITKLHPNWVTTFTVAGPVLSALVVYIAMGFIRPWHNTASDELVDALNEDSEQAA